MPVHKNSGDWSMATKDAWKWKTYSTSKLKNVSTMDGDSRAWYWIELLSANQSFQAMNLYALPSIVPADGNIRTDGLCPAKSSNLIKASRVRPAGLSTHRSSYTAWPLCFWLALCIDFLATARVSGSSGVMEWEWRFHFFLRCKCLDVMWNMGHPNHQR